MDQSFHVRTISFPPKSHPTELEVEEEQQALKASSTNLLPSSVHICNGLRGVRELYTSVEDLLHLPSLQHTVIISSNQRKKLEDELELTVMLLDLVDSMKQLLAAMSEHVQDLQLALRRRGSKNFNKHACGAYKEMQKNVGKRCKTLRKMNEKCGSVVPLDRDSDLSVVVRVRIESRDVTLCALDAVLHFLSTVAWQKPRGRWSFALKTTTQKRKVACEAQQKEGAGVLSLCSSHSCILKKGVDDERVLLQVQEQLVAAEGTIGALESEMQDLLGRLIQCRVSFLSILSLL